jgi:hypothetical protein
MVLMIVEVTRAGHGQWSRLSALTRHEEPDGVDLTAVGIRRIGSALDVVGLDVVVDERDTLAHSDDQLTWVGARRRDPDDWRVGRRRRCRAGRWS